MKHSGLLRSSLFPEIAHRDRGKFKAVKKGRNGAMKSASLFRKSSVELLSYLILVIEVNFALVLFFELKKC